MKISRHLQNALNSLKRAPIVLIVGNLLVSTLTAVSFGLLIGPLLGAYQEIVIKMQRDGHRPRLHELASGFYRFRQLFPLLFLALIIMVGLGVYILPGLMIATMWLYALPLMADRRMPLTRALNTSADMVKEKGFLKHLLFVLLLTVFPTVLANVLGNLIPAARPALLFLLALFLFPIQQGCLASLYLAAFPPEGTEVATGNSES